MTPEEKKAKITALTVDGIKTGKWFDTEKATLYKEETKHNGSNWISLATGSQWAHEFLYVTAGGVFVLNSFSDYQGSTETYEIITKEEAAEWFVKNEYKEDDLPEIFKEAVNDLEVK